MCTACRTAAFDQAAADRFAAQMLGHINGAAITLMASIGHRTGLFDAMSDCANYTSHDLAQKAGLSERYVREWLGAMATANIVTYDPLTGHYHLPEEHAAFLTRAAVPNNTAASAQWIAVLGSVEDEVVDAFGHGRGVPYSAYHRFREVMAEESYQTTVAGLDQHIVPMVPGLEEKLREGIDVVDVGCGSGWALIHLAKRYPNSRFVGVDLLEEQIAAATKRAQSEGLANIRFEAHDMTQWDARERFDLVFTFDAVHDQARPDLVLANIARALKPDGIYIMQDIKASSHLEQNMSLPLGPFTYTISCMHCMSVSLASGGMGLGAAWGKELAMRMLSEAGLETTAVNELPHDIINLYYISRPRPKP